MIPAGATHNRVKPEKVKNAKLSYVELLLERFLRFLSEIYIGLDGVFGGTTENKTC